VSFARTSIRMLAEARADKVKPGSLLQSWAPIYIAYGVPSFKVFRGACNNITGSLPIPTHWAHMHAVYQASSKPQDQCLSQRCILIGPVISASRSTLNSGSSECQSPVHRLHCSLITASLLECTAVSAVSEVAAISTHISKLLPRRTMLSQILQIAQHLPLPTRTARWDHLCSDPGSIGLCHSQFRQPSGWPQSLSDQRQTVNGALYLRCISAGIHPGRAVIVTNCATQHWCGLFGPGNAHLDDRHFEAVFRFTVE
jgi:hypothetical protein